MFKVIKNKGKVVHAYQLGRDHPVLNQLIAQGQIKKLEDGRYEVFSQEALNGETEHGQVAEKGDWIKIDGKGYPYPNKREYFEANHRYVEDDTYEQLPKPLQAWNVDCEMCDEVSFLIKKKGLKIDKDSYERYYSAHLWGTDEVANKDAWIIFYNIIYDQGGKIKDVEFNFAEKTEFDRTYSIIM